MSSKQDLPLYVLTCKDCGIQFGAWRNDAVYCSGMCRQQAYRKRKKQAA